MGLDVNGVRFLLYCKALGVDFARTATIGRQGLHLPGPQLMRVHESFGYRPDAREIESMLTRSNGFAEGFLESIGANQTDSFDNSSYEGATYVHDMNRELPDKFKGQYTTVFDGGSLEHVFNFPVAIKNCMEMVDVGGHYLALNPGNNLLGHGFYQFSPELYFSVFTRENGFELKHVIAFAYDPRLKWDARWYSVKSPLDVRTRVELTNSDRVNLLIMAKKISHAPIFEKTPQQSDYVAMWNDADKGSDDLPGPTSPPLPERTEYARLLKRGIPAPVRRRVRRVLSKLGSRSSSPFDPRFFSPMDPTEVGGKTPDKAPPRTS